MTWRPVPLALDTDLAHGGRWTSLRTDRREWLWTHRDPAVARVRRQVTPGADFVDAGGVEECFPTVRGRPDHGDAWTRAWHGSQGAAEVVVAGGLRLQREITAAARVVSRYRIDGPPGSRFVHAVHALVDVGPAAYLEASGVRRLTVLADGEPGVDDLVRPWPSGLDRLGPDDGTAVCVLLPDCREVSVIDGDEALRFQWTCPERPEICSLLLWRNLAGWPAGQPYRSIGIEPMVGRTAEVVVGSSDAVELGPDGQFCWELEIVALQR